ncbi:MAG: hypothetical protein ACE366_10060 [Bradymonadia bacterium]
MSHHRLSDEILALYLEGRLDGPELDAVHRALAADPALQEELLLLAGVVDVEPSLDFTPSEAMVASLSKSATDLWAKMVPSTTQVKSDALLSVAIRWLGDCLAPLAEALQPLTLQTAMVRGAAQPQGADELRYHVTLADLPLEIDLASEGPGRASLFVRPLSPPPTGLMIRLALGGETRAMSLLSAEGASMDSLMPGAYELILEQSNQPVARLEMCLFAEDDSNA